MEILWGFACLGCLLVAAFRALRDILSPKRRCQRKEVERLMKETDELLGRKSPK